MSWESDAEPRGARGRDWIKYGWYAVIVAIVVMLGLLLIPRSSPTTETRVRVKHILIAIDDTDEAEIQAAFETAKSVRQRILDGESFSKLAGDYSGDPGSASLGGDLGWVARGELTGAIDKYVWEAPLNQLSDLILTSYGLHIVIVTDRKIADAEQYERELQERVLGEFKGGAQP